MASLSNTFLMIPRELPSYLSMAYSVRYTNTGNLSGYICRCMCVVLRALSLLKELIYYRPSQKDFEQTIKWLQKDFGALNENIANNKKPLCIYLVSTHDENGAILGKHVYYYHHYKINVLQQHFAVAATLVSSQADIKTFMKSIKTQHPQREIQFVDLVCHGTHSSLSIGANDEPAIDQIDSDLFADCAADATILLDACETGQGNKNIANEIAKKTLGRTLLAPGSSLFFSKPVIRNSPRGPRVVSAVHGFAIFNAYTCRSFQYK